MKQFFFGSTFTGNKAFNIAWLLFRFYIGFTIAIGAGWPKMNELSAPGWFVKQVSEIGFTFPSPEFWAAMASWGEFVGGLCIAIGFFTRFSALQLAFQFFVVSFIWYDNPMPMLGMYYQQLLFWCFVVIMFAGSGKYAVDEWIMKRKTIRPQTASFAPAAMMLLFITTSSFNTKNDEPIIVAADLMGLTGNWKGTLTYKDYTSGGQESIAVNIAVRKKAERSWTLRFNYSQEPNAGTTEKFKLSTDGRMMNGSKVVEKTILPDGTLKVVLEERGKDGNDQKPCTFNHVILLNKSQLRISKLVKFDNETTFFRRNEFNVSK
jgi:uncharacterized membrane protein YphA (DoxX/SURF4 family)